MVKLICSSASRSKIKKNNIDSYFSAWRRTFLTADFLALLSSNNQLFSSLVTVRKELKEFRWNINKQTVNKFILLVHFRSNHFINKTHFGKVLICFLHVYYNLHFKKFRIKQFLTQFCNLFTTYITLNKVGLSFECKHSPISDNRDPVCFSVTEFCSFAGSYFQSVVDETHDEC